MGCRNRTAVAFVLLVHLSRLPTPISALDMSVSLTNIGKSKPKNSGAGHCTWVISCSAGRHTSCSFYRWIGAISLIEVILHGILYQALWLSGSWAIWANNMKTFDPKHASALPGAVSWGGAILIAAFVYTRRRAYKVWQQRSIARYPEL